MSFAQSSSEATASIAFDFSNPGAKSLGLGGAFVGLADDATAAFANPAGLVQLSRAQTSLELRAWEFEHRYADGGRAWGAPTLQGVDTVEGVVEGSTTNRAEDVAFASYVHVGRTWAASLFHQQLSQFEATLRTGGVFVTDPAARGSFRIYPADVSLGLDVWSVGLSGAWCFWERDKGRAGAEPGSSEPDEGARSESCDSRRMSIGASLSEYRGKFTSTSLRYLGPQADMGFGPATYEAERLLFREDQNGSDSDYAFTVGLHLRGNNRVSMGLAYRQGPSFDVRGVVSQGAALKAFNTGFPDPLITPESGSLKVPDVWAAGVAVEVTDGLRVVFDVNRVEYSDLLNRFLDFAEVRPAATGLGIHLLEADEYVVEDGEEIRAGAEYRWLHHKYGPSIRVGVWREPSHRTEYVGIDAREAARWLPGRSYMHATIGAGVILFGDRLRIDAAADLSKSVDTFALSAVVRRGWTRR